jgi:methyltransferase (TIGR00027 family)
MKPNEASRTAEFNALFRAIESSRRPGKRLFEDNLAHGFLDRLNWAYHVARLPLIGNIMPLYIDLLWPGVRNSALGRTCMIDDQLRRAIRDGIQQLVILGVGYDCRAYRIKNADQMRIFEIDHPDTLKEKSGRLKKLIGSIPENVKLVAVDFDREDFASALDNSAFDRARKTFFIWEGVMHYLTGQAVDTTLRSIRSLSAPGSRLIFTYIHKGLLDGTAGFGNMGRVKKTLKKTGEEWKFGLYPEKIRGYLLDRGFTLITDTGSIEYRSQYMGNSRRILRGFEFYRLALAEVAKV